MAKLRVALRNRGSRLGLIFVLALCAVLPACSLIPGGDDEDRPPIELSSLRVGVTNSIDTLPLRLAVQKGHFEQADLRIDIVEQNSPSTALQALREDKIEVAFGDNITLLQEAEQTKSLELQAEAYVSGRNTMALVTMPGSGYDTPSAKPNPRIGIPGMDKLGVLATKSCLRIEGVDLRQAEFIDIGYDSIDEAFTQQGVDAVWLAEPLISKAQKELGAEIVSDTSRGAMLDFPVSSYAARKVFAMENPKTLDRFRELLGDAQRLAADPSVVREGLMEFLDVDPMSAMLISVGTFPTSVNAGRVQRVADQMLAAGLLRDRLDVTTLVPESTLPGS